MMSNHETGSRRSRGILPPPQARRMRSPCQTKSCKNGGLAFMVVFRHAVVRNVGRFRWLRVNGRRKLPDLIGVPTDGAGRIDGMIWEPWCHERGYSRGRPPVKFPWQLLAQVPQASRSRTVRAGGTVTGECGKDSGARIPTGLSNPDAGGL